MASIKITQAQKSHFDTQGFLVLRASEHEVVDPSTLQHWADEVSNLPRETGKWMPYDEITSSGERQIMRTENFAPYHKGFNSLLFGAALRSMLAQVTGEEMLLFKDKINYKLPGGNGFGAHLDAPAYNHIGHIEHTTANLAVDAATIANGCIEIVPGSHRMNVKLSHGGAIDAEWEGSHDWTPVELEAGDLLIFGSHLAHRSASNKTEKPRRSVYATYACARDGQDLRDKYYADRRENFPPDHGTFRPFAFILSFTDCLKQREYWAKTMALVLPGTDLRRLSRRSFDVHTGRRCLTNVAEGRPKRWNSIVIDLLSTHTARYMYRFGGLNMTVGGSGPSKNSYLSFWVIVLAQRSQMIYCACTYTEIESKATAFQERQKCEPGSLFDQTVRPPISRVCLCSNAYGFVNMALDDCIDCFDHGVANRLLGARV